MEVGTLWGPETTVVAGTVVAAVAVDEHASETTKHRLSKYVIQLHNSTINKKLTRVTAPCFYKRYLKISRFIGSPILNNQMVSLRLSFFIYLEKEPRSSF